MRLALLFLAGILLAQPSHAQDRRPSTLPRIVINWIDNLSIGSINTAIGAGNLVVAFVAQPFTDDDVRISCNGVQICVRTYALRATAAHSLGLFSFGSSSQDHEAGHSLQSGSLGPLYLPTVGFTYLAHGRIGGYSVVEHWAELEGDALAGARKLYQTTSLPQIGFGELRSDDVHVPYLILKFTLDDRLDQEYSDYRLQKTYEWLKTQLLIPVREHIKTNGRKLPMTLETNVLTKTVRLGAGDGWPDHWGNQPRVALDTEQQYGRVRSDGLLGLTHVNALSWAAKLGFNYIMGKGDTQITAVAGGGISLDRVTPHSERGLFDRVENRNGIGTSLAASLDFRLFEYLTVYGTIEQYGLAETLKRKQSSIGLHNRLRPSSAAVPAILSRLEFDIELLRQQYEAPQADQRHTLDWIRASLGVRF
ncbi:MAG: hypothetical protein V1495_00135 [Pseudomonadota bacterium]